MPSRRRKLTNRIPVGVPYLRPSQDYVEELKDEVGRLRAELRVARGERDAAIRRLRDLREALL